MRGRVPLVKSLPCEKCHSRNSRYLETDAANQHKVDKCFVCGKIHHYYGLDGEELEPAPYRSERGRPPWRAGMIPVRQHPLHPPRGDSK